MTHVSNVLSSTIPSSLNQPPALKRGGTGNYMDLWKNKKSLDHLKPVMQPNGPLVCHSKEDVQQALKTCGVNDQVVLNIGLLSQYVKQESFWSNISWKFIPQDFKNALATELKAVRSQSLGEDWSKMDDSMFFATNKLSAKKLDNGGVQVSVSIWSTEKEWKDRNRIGNISVKVPPPGSWKLPSPISFWGVNANESVNLSDRVAALVDVANYLISTM